MTKAHFGRPSGVVVTGTASRSKEGLDRVIKGMLLGSGEVIGFLKFNHESDVLITPYSFIQKCAINIE